SATHADAKAHKTAAPAPRFVRGVPACSVTRAPNRRLFLAAYGSCSRPAPYCGSGVPSQGTFTRATNRVENIIICFANKLSELTVSNRGQPSANATNKRRASMTHRTNLKCDAWKRKRQINKIDLRRDGEADASPSWRPHLRPPSGHRAPELLFRLPRRD